MTGLLLDTHAALWWWVASGKLSGTAHSAITSEIEVYLSAASVWEIAIKSHAGRMPEIVDFRRDYPLLLERSGFQVLGVDDRHALRGGYLPGDHRDPFDRLIAAQALEEDLTVVTRDPEIAAFGCKVLW